MTKNVVRCILLALLALALAACGQAPGADAFEMTLDSDRLIMVPAGDQDTAVTLRRGSAFSAAIELSVTGLPAELSARVEPGPGADERTLVLSATDAAALGTSQLTVTARGGGVERDAALELVVVDPSDAQITQESYAPGRSGELKTVTVGGVEITYEVIDGLAILDGDMVLGSDDELQALAFVQRPRGEALDPQGTVIDCWLDRICSRWPNAVIPYEIESGAWGSSSGGMETRIEQAVAHWNTNTVVRLVPRTDQSDYVRFQAGSGCSAKLGRRGGRQSIKLSVGCTVGSIIHEIGHAAGLMHEHTRNDRGDFVDVNRRNVSRGNRHNFRRRVARTDDIGGYDYGSIMHYGCWDFSKNGRKTLDPKTEGVGCAGEGEPVTVGQRAGLSPGDIATVCRIYDEGASLAIRNPAAGFSASYADPIGFLADAFDQHGEPLDAVVWTSDRDGELGRGASIDTSGRTLSLGTHTVTASLTDVCGTVLTDTVTVTVTDSPPEALITAPAGATAEITIGQPFTFEGSGIDPDEGELACSELYWTSSNPSDPFPRSGCTALANFASLGTRTITLEVTDPRGNSASAEVLVDVVAEPQPVVDLVTPANGTEFFDTQTIPLEATVSDGTPPYSASWSLRSYQADDSTVFAETTLPDDALQVDWKPRDDTPALLDPAVCFQLDGQRVDVTIRVTDDAGKVAERSATIRVVCDLI